MRWTWQVKLAWQLEAELLTALRERSEEEAIRVFAHNLHDLLLAAPAGPRSTMGLDPGLRTGVKVAIVDHTGKLLETATVYPHVPRNEWDRTIAHLALLAEEAQRRSDQHRQRHRFARDRQARRRTDQAASGLEAHEDRRVGSGRFGVLRVGAGGEGLPDLDASLRGAVSIARRLQDPLAELVKIDPKSIGVGQYQHDVSQTKLAKSLDAVVEDCVNAVGVDVNTASAALLARISGLSSTLAENIVRYRDEHGTFANRAGLKKVPRLGDKTFEQAAGFLRVMNGDNPLDRSAVHPEAYPVVERIIADLKKPVKEVLGDGSTLKKVDPARFTDEKFGLPTVKDILKELEEAGPRSAPRVQDRDLQGRRRGAEGPARKA